MSDIAVSASGLLREFSEAGLLTWADVHPAQHLCFLYRETDERVALAAALTVRALRAGSLCIDLQRVAAEASQWEPDDPDAVPEPSGAASWPEPSEWLAAVAASPAVTLGEQDGGVRPLRLVGGLLYLERYWQDQESVRAGVLGRLTLNPAPLGSVPVGASDDPRARDQDAAVYSAMSRGFTLIAGGPGTGKTHVLARIVRAFTSGTSPALVALAAPTGKAAARMTESLRASLAVGDVPDAASGLAASTVHRLLGWRPGSRTRFRYDRANPLPHDVVVVDEVSMVSMTLMARLLAALKPGARLILVGDPDQLASVEAGAVLADLTASAALAPAVVRLAHNFRFQGAIAELANAIRLGDADAALDVLGRGEDSVRLVAPADAQAELRARCVTSGARLWTAAMAGDAGAALGALDSHRLLCAHRRGAYGVQQWSHTVTRWLLEDVPGFTADAEFYVGRPLLMTRNAADLGLFNGDTGVIVDRNGQSQAVFATGSGPKTLSPYLLDGLESVHAMTIHKSQGSQFERVSVILPPVGSPLLTRELLYTAVTRAQVGVFVVGTPESVRAAVERPAARTSGLRHRLDG